MIFTNCDPATCVFTLPTSDPNKKETITIKDINLNLAIWIDREKYFPGLATEPSTTIHQLVDGKKITFGDYEIIGTRAKLTEEEGGKVFHFVLESAQESK
ncbi:hypothetical protein GGI10_004829 [Coemansia sp. RSA 2530]|nr:hypothetical protein GGI10_004829 [Coemansia sp. RSA 2530]